MTSEKEKALELEVQRLKRCLWFHDLLFLAILTGLLVKEF